MTYKIFRRMIRRYSIDILAGAVIPILIAMAILSFVFRPGYVFYGDVLPFFPFFVQSWYSTWHNQVASFDFVGSPQALLLLSLDFLVGTEITLKIHVLLLSALPATSMFFSSKLLFREWGLTRKRLFEYVGSIAAGMFYMLNFANPGMTFSWSQAWVYITLPIIVACYSLALKKRKFHYVALFGFATVLGSVFPDWLFLALPIVLAITVVELLSASKAKVALYAMGCAIVALLFNAFWWIPTFIGYTQNASGAFSTYTSSKLITFESLQYLSYYRLQDVVMFGQPTYSLFHIFPQNWTILNVVIISTAFASIVITRNRRVAALGLAALSYIFLANGANPPFGHLYYSMASSLPYGTGAILRNPTFFMIPLALTYSLMIGVTLAQEARVIAGRRADPIRIQTEIVTARKHLSLGNLLKKSKPALTVGTLIVLAVLLFGSTLYGNLVNVQAYTSPYFSPRNIPFEYTNAISFLSSQTGTFNVMWLPLGGYYTEWGRTADVMTDFPDSISPLPSTPPNYLFPYLTSTHFLGKLLAITNTRYLVFHSDAIPGTWGVSLSNEQLLAILMAQQDLKVAWHEDFIYVFANTEPTSPFFAPDILYTAGNIPYSFLLEEPWQPTSLAVTNFTSIDALADSSMVILSNTTAEQLGENLRLSSGQVSNLLDFPNRTVIWMANGAEASAVDLPSGSYPIVDNMTAISGQNITQVVGGDGYFSFQGLTGFSPGEAIDLTLKYNLPPSLRALYAQHQGLNRYFSATLDFVPSGSSSIYQQFYQVFAGGFVNNLSNYTGYISFNQTFSGTPAIFPDFTGSFHILLWFYTSGFNHQGPYFDLGTYYVPDSGAWQTQSPEGAPSAAILKDSLPIQVYSPLNGNLTIALQESGPIGVEMANQTLPQDTNGNWSYCHVSLSRGYHTIIVSSVASDPAVLHYVLVYGRNTPPDRLFVVNDLPTVLSAAQDSNTRWQILLGQGAGRLIAFSDSYDPLWRITNANAEHIPLFDGLVSPDFYAPVTGSINGYILGRNYASLTLSYSLQNYYSIGAAISLSSMIMAAVIGLRSSLLISLMQLIRGSRLVKRGLRMKSLTRSR